MSPCHPELPDLRAEWAILSYSIWRKSLKLRFSSLRLSSLVLLTQKSVGIPIYTGRTLSERKSSSLDFFSANKRDIFRKIWESSGQSLLPLIRNLLKPTAGLGWFSGRLWTSQALVLGWFCDFVCCLFLCVSLFCLFVPTHLLSPAGIKTRAPFLAFWLTCNVKKADV